LRVSRIKSKSGNFFFILSKDSHALRRSKTFFSFLLRYIILILIMSKYYQAIATTNAQTAISIDIKGRSGLCFLARSSNLSRRDLFSSPAIFIIS
jgi:hypothetical protein